MKKVKHYNEKKKNVVSGSENFQRTNPKNSKNNTKKNTNKEGNNFLDTFAPKDYYFQIYLTIAVTTIVIMCIFSVGKKTSRNVRVSPYEFPKQLKLHSLMINQQGFPSQESLGTENTESKKFKFIPEIPLADR
jgi:hypothetical protein